MERAKWIHCGPPTTIHCTRAGRTEYSVNSAWGWPIVKYTSWCANDLMEEGRSVSPTTPETGTVDRGRNGIDSALRKMWNCVRISNSEGGFNCQCAFYYLHTDPDLTLDGTKRETSPIIFIKGKASWNAVPGEKFWLPSRVPLSKLQFDGRRDEVVEFPSELLRIWG